jgi:hypothetical protein
MKILTMFADAASSTLTDEVAAVIAVVGGLLALICFFATRREVDKMDDRITKIEDALPPMERRIEQAGEKRAEKIHYRINRVSDGVARIAGHLGVKVPKPDVDEERD